MFKAYKIPLPDPDTYLKLALLKTKTKVVRPTVPWYNNEIDCARRLRRKAERKWRRTRRTEDLKEFKAKRNYVTHLLNKARRECYTQFMEEKGTDQGKLFKSANRLLGIKESLAPCFPDHLDNMLLANDVGNFVVKKIDNIHSQITSMKINASDVALVPPDLMVDEGKTLCSVLGV